MTATPDLALALDALRAVGSRVHTATDDELLADGAVIEELGRLVDAHRLDFAAEVERRTVSPDGGLPLARREGARDAVDLVAHLARIGRPAAKQRIGLGAALAPEVSLRGDLLPGRFGVLADAVRAGEVGVESARVVVTKLLHLRPRITAEEFADAVVVLTDAAKAEETEVVRDVAEGLALLLDPDGAEPTERNQRFQRAFALGRTRADGMTAARLLLTPEHLAVVKELLESQRRGVPLLRTAAGGGQDGDGLDPEWRESLPAEGDEPRSRAQQDYDTVLGAIESGVRAEQSAAVTHEVVVHVAADDLEARRGQGWTSGVLAGIPIPVIERRACGGGVRLLVTGAHGEPLHLSRSKRVFTAAQKKALTARAGGRCEFPGCITPAPYLEAHHVAWFHRDGGRTDVGNGVMLCSHHHHLIHAPWGRVEIRRWRNELWFVPKRWQGDPLPEHRRQPGPFVDPRLARRRREHDPGPRAA
ncbi:HNH endonuclease signature motif containing protein [Amnibacterium setariae]|uniref:HNH endonuclease signature motif containing protein n=1 Tax=Amnibacterium setariae TaxID=2306585 RepID=UPI0013144E6A|nr:HNH endonuclease signature motif containing protein [Amnibacterium setariae]